MLLDHAAIIQHVTQAFEASPFCRHLQAHVAHVDRDTVIWHLPKQPFLMGSVSHERLHGGVIAAVLDTAGGMLTVLQILMRMASVDDAMLPKLASTATIHLQVDYLRPGAGDRFEAKAVLLRAGRRVVFTDLYFTNHEQVLLAKGSASYVAGF